MVQTRRSETAASLPRLIARRAPARQRGIVLLIALIAVFMLMFAGLATLRSVDTTNLLTGNLAFREGAVQTGDYGLESALGWLKLQTTPASGGNPSNLFYNLPATGGSYYYAYWDDSFDPTTYNWTNSQPVSQPPYVCGTPGNPATPPCPYSVQYVVHRMCQTQGDFTNGTTSCYMASILTQPSPPQGSIVVGQGVPTGSSTASPYYRITALVTGPRNTQAYVQTVVF